MISRDDLRAAVGSGLLSEAQAASLSALADSRRGARENLAPGDEPFELFKGFNEIFIVVGLGILAMGWIAVNTASMLTEIVNYRTQATTAALIGAAVLWGLSEYFIRRRRMVAPAIALSVMFAGNAATGFIAQYAQPFMIAQQDYSSLPMALTLSTLALFAFWGRFRVPFAMALIALGLFAVALIVAADQSGVPTELGDLFRLSANGPFAWITLAVGLLVFAVAMAFDLSDPHRVTRRSAQGFWLHVVAAPALVNTIALSLLEGDQGLLLAIVLAFFALVAIVIDRRSFLITAIGYIVALSTTVFDSEGTGISILALGVVLVILGAFWARIRAALLSLLSGVLPLHRLPPSH
ncbi:hypothetical protein MHM88_10685 [Epibacterium sp. MM17-32]|uniref:hypothetical protein n=1 Tax=Epibacterium sp. MM17-32 TaxID=2917734 RepID=UPI001EF52032|nr:hypothetical protein [Epibacterium sp. MM17-32]MCG7628272.1 hypothetical protein [Epibacterium sp. MM17-32]